MTITLFHVEPKIGRTVYVRAYDRNGAPLNGAARVVCITPTHVTFSEPPFVGWPCTVKREQLV